MTITCGNCKNSHGSVAEVRACYGTTPAAVAATPAPLPQAAADQQGPSEKQVDLIKRLLAEKDLTGTAFPSWTDEVIAQLTPGRDGTASKGIDMLFKLPRKAAQLEQHEVAAGAYRVDGRIIRVYLGQQSGKMLAAELVDATARDRDAAWRYLGQAFKHVPADSHRMTPEECEAVNAGHTDHGWCCVCGRALDVPESVARGIGPVCWAKQGGA